MIYVLAISILLTPSCKLFLDDPSERKFGGMEHTIGNVFTDLKRVEFLTKHVHNKSWHIVYGFGCDSSICSNSAIPYKNKKLLTVEEKKKHKMVTSYVEGRIALALETWLAPLNRIKLDKEVITKKDFKFTELSPEPDKLSSSGFIYTPDYLKANNLLNNIDLVVIIGGRISYACPKRSWELFSDPLRLPPFVYMRHDVGIDDTTGNSRWEHILLHELGHAFGLVDTYPNAFTDTQGQSASVMSMSLRKHQTTPSLAQDDIRGMEWLYYFYHDRQKLKKNECFFDDYEVVKNDEGKKICRPIYPVIHEIKQAYFKEQHGSIAEARGFMTSAIKISDDLKNKKDKDGRTALHYAVIHEGKSIEMKVDWRQTIKSLLDAGFDKKIKDNAGKTACDYLQCKESEDGTKTEVKCSEIRKLLCQ